MRLLKGLMALTVAMGVTTAAHADGWKHVLSQNIIGVTADIDHNVTPRLTYITLNVANEDNTCCGSCVNFDVYQDNPIYNQAIVLFNRASIEGKDLDISVQCVNRAGFVHGEAIAIFLHQ